MRKITVESFEVYELDELMPSARTRALDTLVEARSQLWQGPVRGEEQTARAIMLAFGREVDCNRMAGFDRSDFPGVEGVTVDGWDFQNAPSVALDGRLTRENAPDLPWVPGIPWVELESHGVYRLNATTVTLAPGVSIGNNVARKEMEQAVYAALGRAESAGLAAVQRLTTRAAVAEQAAMAGLEFLRDGTLYFDGS